MKYARIDGYADKQPRSVPHRCQDPVASYEVWGGIGLPTDEAVGRNLECGDTDGSNSGYAGLDQVISSDEEPDEEKEIVNIIRSQ